MAAIFSRCSTSCGDLFQFFYPSLLDGRSVVVNRACHDRLLVIIRHIRGEWNALSHAACAFISSHRVFYLDCGKYCYVLWRLAIPEPSEGLEYRSLRKSKFMVFISHCQLSHRCDVKADETKKHRRRFRRLGRNRIYDFSEQQSSLFAHLFYPIFFNH